jgi:hypothetical protein
VGILRKDVLYIKKNTSLFIFDGAEEADNYLCLSEELVETFELLVSLDKIVPPLDTKASHLLAILASENLLDPKFASITFEIDPNLVSSTNIASFNEFKDEILQTSIQDLEVYALYSCSPPTYSSGGGFVPCD